jgi:heterodisulfide reductase subunit B
MESTASAYDVSLKAICAPLDLELDEIHDWNCCGATEYVSLSLTPAYFFMRRILAISSVDAN